MQCVSPQDNVPAQSHEDSRIAGYCIEDPPRPSAWVGDITLSDRDVALVQPLVCVALSLTHSRTDQQTHNTHTDTQ